MGAACVGLALIALFARARCAFILAGVGLASLLVSMGTATPLYGWLTQVPPFKLFQIPWKYYPPAVHAIALMAGMGIGVLCKWGRRGVWLALALAALALVERAAVMPAILSGPFIMPQNPPDVTALESVLPQLLGTAGSDEPAPRVFVDDNPFVLGNLPTVYGVELVAASHTPLMSSRHVSFGMTRPGFQRRTSQAQLDLLGIDLIFSPEPCRKPRWPRVEKLFSSEKACVYRNLTSGPRLELVRTPRIVTNIDELIRVAREAPDGTIPILVEADSQSPPNIIASDEGRVHMTHYERGRIRAEVQSLSPAWLLLRESASAGWRVTVDGKDTSVHPAAGIFFAAPVPAGRHDVEIRFEPPGRAAGTLGAFAWLLLGVGLVTIDRVRQR
jgi:hypothetical protein